MKYWSDYSVFLSCAAVLDPCIKFKFLAYSYSKLYEDDDANRRIADVRSTLTSLFNEYGSVVPVHDNLAKTSMSSTCGLGAFSDYDQYVESTSAQEEKSELELYLVEPVKRLNENIDILDYWSKSAARYPQLARLACAILDVPVSSVALESAFSLNNKRKAEMVELNDDENSSSDEEECNIPILYSCQLVKFNTYFRAYS
ncbi:zinc finger bed domain-containing protein ricesleeper 2-like [Hordeum vulgare]|nr:zinc finger bed domain-containing protein ricesleeper 2-like [Hordeum vulgare]